MVSLKLFSNLEVEEARERLFAEIEERFQAIRERTVRLRETFGPCEFPFQHGEGGTDLGSYLLPELPEEANISTVAAYTEASIDRYFQLYRKLMSEVARICEAVEESLGLPTERGRSPAATTSG